MQYDLKILSEQKRIWKRKTIIRRLYNKWYKMILDSIGKGNTLEIGGGSGNFKEYLPGVISSDIIFTPWLDTVLDAHYLPFKNNSLDNIVLIDVLHHMAAPIDFFSEVERVLRPKGRVVLLEPYISLSSFLVYKYLHQEKMAWNTNPLKTEWLSSDEIPSDGNQAIPTLLFEKFRKGFFKIFPFFKLVDIQRLDFIIYPLSGGFHNPSLCPLFLYPILDHFEDLLKLLGRILAFRLFIVIEKEIKYGINSKARKRRNA